MSGAIVAASIGAVGAVTGGLIASHGASKAANAQVASANHAADISHQDNTAALAYQKQKDTQARADLAPWRTAGGGAVTQLYSDLKSGAYPDWTGHFEAPNAADMMKDPGYEFRVAQGEKAIQSSAASKGGLLTGGTAKALENFSQGMASQEYGDVYARKWNEYMQRYNESIGNNTNRFNRFATVAGLGSTAAQGTAQLGQMAATNVGNIYATDAAQRGQALMASGNARASGYINQANAINSGINGITGNLLLYSMLRPNTSSLYSGVSGGPYGNALPPDLQG